jgi:hypothetical protein
MTIAKFMDMVHDGSVTAGDIEDIATCESDMLRGGEE